MRRARLGSREALLVQLALARAHVAHETAGAFAAWSVRVEPVPGPLAATAHSLARSAQLRAYEVHGQSHETRRISVQSYQQ